MTRLLGVGELEEEQTCEHFYRVLPPVDEVAVEHDRACAVREKVRVGVAMAQHGAKALERAVQIADDVDGVAVLYADDSGLVLERVGASTKQSVQAVSLDQHPAFDGVDGIRSHAACDLHGKRKLRRVVAINDRERSGARFWPGHAWSRGGFRLRFSIGVRGHE